MKTLETIFSVAETDPHRPAITTAGGTRDYRELARTVGGIRRFVRENGHGDDPRIGVVTGSDFLTYASILGILANGSAYVPLNKGNPADRNETVIRAAELDLILTSHRDVSLPDIPGVSVLDTREAQPAAVPSVPDFRPEQLVYLLFTSGSTGTPKGVPIHHANLEAFLDVLAGGELHRFTPEDRFLQMFELTFDFSVMSFFTPLRVGACCHVLPEKGIVFMNILRALEEGRITVAPMVPSVLAYIRRFFGELRLEELRYSIFCGEALPQELVEEWSACVPNARIQNCYGPTEATVYCLAYDWDPERSPSAAVDGVVPIGKPMKGTRALVVDEDGREVPAGRRGELCLAGPQVTTHYWDDPVNTRSAFFRWPKEGPSELFYRTGDLVSVNERGDFLFRGRKDFQIKIDGHRVELGEIEHHARSFTGEPMAAVVGVREGPGSTALHLFVLDRGADTVALAEHLGRKLPEYMQPRRIHLLEEFPLNRNGKIDRKALRRRVERVEG